MRQLWIALVWRSPQVQVQVRWTRTGSSILMLKKNPNLLLMSCPTFICMYKYIRIWPNEPKPRARLLGKFYTNVHICTHYKNGNVPFICFLWNKFFLRFLTELRLLFFHHPLIFCSRFAHLRNWTEVYQTKSIPCVQKVIFIWNDCLFEPVHVK